MKSYQTGRKAIATGDISTARTAFRWAVGQDPENPVYIYAAAVAALKEGRKDEAETLLRRAIEDTVNFLGCSHPHLITVTHSLAQLYLKEGQYDDAHELCARTVVATDPKVTATANARTLRRLAMLYRTAGRPRDAVGLYRRALTHRRANYGDRHAKISECLAGLAEVHHHLGSFGKARALLKLATKLARNQTASTGAAQDGEPCAPRPSVESKT